jgi:hypothetical protein
MPSNHISNTDYHEFLELTMDQGPAFYVDYKALRLQKAKLQCRCSSHRQALELTLTWLKANTDIHPATTISNLAEDSVWAKLKKE